LKIVYSDRKSGKTAQVELQKDNEALLLGRKIGDVFDGSIAGLEGFKLQITGLSDKMGSPSRSDIEGTRKAKPILSGGPGIILKHKGYRARKLVRGNTISAETEQVNAVIIEYGTKPVDEIFAAKKKEE